VVGSAQILIWFAAVLWVGVASALLWRAHRRHAARQAAEPQAWQSRPVLGAAVHVFALLVPIAAAIATSALLSRQMAMPETWPGRIASFAFLMLVSSVVLVLVDRLARRLLPLAALLRLSMVFPDRAPDRLKVARNAGTRDLARRLHHARHDGLGDTPAEAAERILSLASALSSHDRRTRGHSERVRMYTDLIAGELKLSDTEIDRLRWASLLHDVGKLEVPPTILNKPGKPTPGEWAHLHRHPDVGFKMTEPLHDWLGDWAITIQQHHERYDGAGYPKGLKGDEISLGARIVAVADAYEVMTTVRAYKKAMPPALARAELAKQAGAQFDPVIVRAFLNISLGKQRWVMGPVTWLGQLPFIGWVPRLAEGAATVAGPAAGVAGAAASAAVLSAATMSVGFREGELPPIPDSVFESPAATPAEPPPAADAEVLGETFFREVADAPPPASEPAVDLPGNSERANGEGPQVEDKEIASTSNGNADPDPAPVDSGNGIAETGPLDIDPETPGVQPPIVKGPKK
jgi:HD-GYP domain-containing protein (c-di-GMP phosphodiesterase class II)